MASAQSYVLNLPSTSVGVNPNMTDDSFGSGSSVWSKIANFFGGVDSSSLYQNALTENNRAYEQAMLRESRDYDAFLRSYNADREDTQIQRLVADIKAAGLNPWLALQSGGVSGSSANIAGQGSSSKPGGGSSAKSKSDDDGSGIRSLAMLLFSTAHLLTKIPVY